MSDESARRRVMPPPEAAGPLSTCGHRAPPVTLPPRCTRCGAYARGPGEDRFSVTPRLWWLLEWLTRRHVRRLKPPRLEARITYAGGTEQP